MRGISLDLANTIINNCRVISKNLNAPPLAFVILDNGGLVKASMVEDKTGTLRYKIAFGKANAALGMGFNSRDFYTYLQNGILPIQFSQSINGVADGNFVPMPGGVLIYQNKEIVGAIGISGASSDLDEKIAVLALKKSNTKTI